MKTALSLIIDERTRQQDAEGWTPQHDDTHTDGELARAAACYAVAASAQLQGCDSDEIHDLTVPRVDWPWDEEAFKLADPMRNLIKAGALILAEIERLQRGMGENDES